MIVNPLTSWLYKVQKKADKAEIRKEQQSTLPEVVAVVAMDNMTVF
jgi:hypothetical protein